MNRIDLTVLVVRHALALVFLVAAAGKLRDRDATRTAAVDLGVARRFAGPISIGLPVTELGIAGTLLLPASAGIAGCVAFALVAAFTVLVAVQLVRGRRPSCNCFGAGEAPIGATTVVRNVLLLAASASVGIRWLAGVTGDGADACRVGCPGELSAGQIVALTASAVVAVVLAAHTWAIVQLLRQRGELLQRLGDLETRFGGPLLPSHAPLPVRHDQADRAGQPEPPDALGHPRRRGTHRRVLAIGSPAPRFSLPDVTGREVGIDELLGITDAIGGSHLPTVVLFLETRCEACVSLAAEIAERSVADGPATDRRLVAVVGGDPDAVADRIDARGFAHVLVDTGGAVAQRYGVAGSPTGLVVLADGRVASPFAEGRAAVSRLVRGTTSTATDLPHPVLQEALR